MKIEHTGYWYKNSNEEIVEIQTEETYERDSVFTIRNVLKVLSVICAIFFCPTFMESCSGQRANIRAMPIVGELTVFGEKATEEHPYMFILLALPIIIWVILFMEMKNEQSLPSEEGSDCS